MEKVCEWLKVFDMEKARLKIIQEQLYKQINLLLN